MASAIAVFSRPIVKARFAQSGFDKWPRDRVPLQWAKTKSSLDMALALLASKNGPTRSR
jgi:hypothetical protein